MEKKNRCTFNDCECESAKCEESALNSICPILLDGKPCSAYCEYEKGLRNEPSSIYLLRNCGCKDYQIKPCGDHAPTKKLCGCKDYRIKPCGDHACTKKLPAVPYDIVQAILKRKMREMEKRRGRTGEGRTNKKCHICNNSMNIGSPGQFNGVCSYCALLLRQALESCNCQAVTAARGLGGGCFSKKKKDPATQQKDPAAQQKVPAAQQKVPTAQQNNPAAQQNNPAAQQKVPTAQQRDPAAQQNVPTGQQKALAAQRQGMSPQRQSMTSQRKDLPPQQKDSRESFTSQRKGLPPQRQSMTSQRKDLPPQQKDSRESFTSQRKDLPPQRQSMTSQRKDLRTQRKDLYTQTGSTTPPEDYAYQPQDLNSQLQDYFCQSQEMTYQQPNVIVLQDRDNNSLIDHLMAVINQDAAPYNNQRYKDQDSRYNYDPPCRPCDYYDEYDEYVKEDYASLDISCHSIQCPYNKPKSKSCICSCEACRKNDEVQKNLSALFIQALELFIQKATQPSVKQNETQPSVKQNETQPSVKENTSQSSVKQNSSQSSLKQNATQPSKKKKQKKKPAGKAQSKPASAPVSNSSSKKSAKNVSQSGSVASIKTGKPKDQKDNTTKNCCCDCSSRNQNKYILPEVSKSKKSSNQQRNANGSTNKKEGKSGSTNQNRSNLTKKPTQHKTDNNRQNKNSKRAAKGNEANNVQSQNSNKSSRRQSQERAYGASPNSKKPGRCTCRRSAGQTDLSIQKNSKAPNPIAHYRPGMLQDIMVNYVKAGNVCRRSVVRTAAGVTVHEKTYNIISQI